jgi:hypothetical protein
MTGASDIPTGRPFGICMTASAGYPVGNTCGLNQPIEDREPVIEPFRRGLSLALIFG